MKLPSRLFTKPVLIGLGLVAFMAVSGLVGWYIATRITSAPAAGNKELRATLRQLGRHIILPTGEDPTLATVSDKTKLKDPFLRKAENGDKIVIYYKAKKAIIFRPSAGKIVDVGPLLVDATLSEVKDTRIVIRNGSRNEPLTRVLEDKIKKAYPEAAISATGPASRLDFPKTIIVDLTAKQTKPSFTAALAQVAGGQVGVLPTGESKPADGDILVLIGADSSDRQ